MADENWQCVDAENVEGKQGQDCDGRTGLREFWEEWEESNRTNHGQTQHMTTSSQVDTQ